MTDQAFTDDILSILANNGNKLAISDLHASLTSRFQGSSTADSGRKWRNLGNLSSFDSELNRLGFTVYRSRNERGNAGLFVSLGEEIHPARELPTGFLILANGYRATNAMTGKTRYVSRFKRYGQPTVTTDITEAKVYKTQAGAKKAAAKLPTFPNYVKTHGEPSTIEVTTTTVRTNVA